MAQTRAGARLLTARRPRPCYGGFATRDAHRRLPGFLCVTRALREERASVRRRDIPDRKRCKQERCLEPLSSAQRSVGSGQAVGLDWIALQTFIRPADLGGGRSTTQTENAPPPERTTGRDSSLPVCAPALSRRTVRPGASACFRGPSGCCPGRWGCCPGRRSAGRGGPRASTGRRCGPG